MTDPLAMASTAGYAEAADALIDQYESVSFADVHREVMHLIPTQPGWVLDIGAGSGRDAAALAGLGHRVLAVEPTAELRHQGQWIHAGQAVEWLDDSLPELRLTQGRGHRFDLILLTGVWMHLDDQQRTSAMANIAGLLTTEGRLIFHLRHGPVPVGRRMFDVSAEETVRPAQGHGLNVIHLGGRPDPHGRPGVHWSYVGLGRETPAG